MAPCDRIWSSRVLCASILRLRTIPKVNYWVALAVTLHAAGYIVSIVNPAKVHHYAQSLSRRSKTDPLDAQLLAQFAVERRPAVWTPPPAIYHELRQRLVARDGLLE